MVLTTVDNPYHPIKQYEQWMKWDRDNEYFTQEYIARLSSTMSDDLEDQEVDEILDYVIESIIENDTIGIYMLVAEE